MINGVCSLRPRQLSSCEACGVIFPRGLEVPGCLQDLVALIAPKRTRRVEFYLVTHQARELEFGSDMLDISNRTIGLELHQHVVLEEAFLRPGTRPLRA